jgi:hypothetical protein
MKRVLTVVFAVLAACGVPSHRDVRRDFLALYPNATVVDVAVGEGDAADAYFDIKYRLPPDTSVLEQVWLYQRGADDRWGVTHRDSSTVTRKDP